VLGTREWSRWAGRAIYTAAIAIILGFGYSGLQGERGLGALGEATALEQALIAERDRLAEERAEIANKVRRLGPAYLDLDLLDERARAVLGLVRPDEVIIRPVTR